jgi:integrase
VAQKTEVPSGDNGNPRWGGIMLTDHIKPAAVRAGIGKVGWHTFRHTFSSILHQAGTSLAVQKELLRHADIQTTMNIYTQAVSVDKREAVELVTKRLLNG